MNWERVELFVQSFLFRLSFIVSFILFVGVFAYAYYTDKKVEQVGDTAPFATQVAKVEDTIETDAVSKAHRTRKEMQVWLVESVSELLNFDAASEASLMKDARPYFTDAGLSQYKAYLQNDNKLADIDAGKIKLGAIVDQTPILLNEGVTAGTYRWLFDVPVIVSVIPLQPGMQAANQPLTLRLQIARAPEGSNPHKIVIESWSMNPRR